MLLIKHLTSGGAERVAALWAQILSDAGYEVTVLTFYPSPGEYPLDPRVTRVNLAPSFEEYSQQDIFYKRLLKQYLAEHPQDIVLPHLSFPNLLAAIYDQPSIKVTTQTILNSPWDKEPGLDLALRDWAIQKQGSVILQNNEQIEYFNRPEFNHVKKYVVHNPLNPAIAKIKKAHYGPIKKIVAVGRLVSQKNHALMIEAIRILRDEFHENYCLDIYGTGKLQETLQAQIDTANLNDQVKLCGRSDDIFHVLINYDLFLMTSLYEGTPNALLEAMGLGVPSLAIQCRTGITELIKNGKNGYIVQGYDAHDLAVKISQINKPARLKRLGKRARKNMARYSYKKIQKELVTVIQDLLNCPPLSTDVPIKNALQQCKLQTQADYQKYFETSLQAIKIADAELGKQIFDQACQVLHGAEINLLNYTKEMYYDCLQSNQFDVFSKIIRKRVRKGMSNYLTEKAQNES